MFDTQIGRSSLNPKKKLLTVNRRLWTTLHCSNVGTITHSFLHISQTSTRMPAIISSNKQLCSEVLCGLTLLFNQERSRQTRSKKRCRIVDLLFSTALVCKIIL